MTEGPARKPINPPVVTIAKPSTLLTPGIFPEALNNTGTTQEQPKPMIIYPATAGTITGDITTIKKPIAAIMQPTTTAFLFPTVDMILSPFSLPIVMAMEKPA